MQSSGIRGRVILAASIEEAEVVAENREIRMEILRYMARSGGGGMSVREVGEAVGLRSSQTAYKHLRRLEEEGYVKRCGERRARGVWLTDRGWEAAGELPLMGAIAAGRPVEAVVEGEMYSLYAELLAPGAGKTRFVLRARGDSMIGAHIADGDLLLVESGEDPPDGAVVAALLEDGTVTVKRLYREGEMVRLRAANEAYEDLLHPAGEVVVQGRVEMVLHPPRR